MAEHDRAVLEDVISVYGGEIKPWKDNDGSPAWQAIVAAECLDVAIPPDDSALSIWYEQWRGGYCVVRCNGNRCTRPVGKGAEAHWEEGPCRCDPTTGDEVCGLVTRLNVVLLGVPAYGLFRLDTGSAHAARTFPAVVAMTQRMAHEGNPVPATLSIQAKTTKNLGRPTPKQNFRIPVLRLAVGLTRENLIASAEAAPQIEAPKPTIPPPSEDVPPEEDVVDGEATTTDTVEGDSAEGLEGVAARQQAPHDGARPPQNTQAQQGTPDGDPKNESAPASGNASGPAWRDVRYADRTKTEHFTAYSTFQKQMGRVQGMVPRNADDLTFGEIVDLASGAA